VLVLSQYVEETYARDLLADGRGGVGYLLKDRVQDLDALAATLDRVHAGETALDPQVVAQLLVRRSASSPLDALTPREREVLGQIAEGRTNIAIAERLVVTLGAVEKHVSSIFAKLGLAASDADHRRVLAVLAWLRGSPGAPRPAGRSGPLRRPDASSPARRRRRAPRPTAPARRSPARA
jgi:DNA-binding NarL/FixJ family response regulator